MLSISSSLLWATEYHVRPSGSDAADGSALHPFRTINHAAQKALPGDNGAEMAGIKLHGAIDAYLHHNSIHHVGNSACLRRACL